MNICHLCRETGEVKIYEETTDDEPRAGTRFYLKDSTCSTVMVYIHYKCLCENLDRRGKYIGSCDACNGKVCIDYESSIPEAETKSKIGLVVSRNMMFAYKWLLFKLVNLACGFNISSLALMCHCLLLPSFIRRPKTFVGGVLMEAAVPISLELLFALAGIKIYSIWKLSSLYGIFCGVYYRFAPENGLKMKLFMTSHFIHTNSDLVNPIFDPNSTELSFKEESTSCADSEIASAEN